MRNSVVALMLQRYLRLNAIRQIINVLAVAVLLIYSLLMLTAARADTRGEVAVGGEHILTIDYPATGMSVRQRADEVTDRLRIILSDPDIKPNDIVAESTGPNEAKITVKGRLLVTVVPARAQLERRGALQLAQVWVNQLRAVLPKVNVKPNPNLIHPTSSARNRK